MNRQIKRITLLMTAFWIGFALFIWLTAGRLMASEDFYTKDCQDFEKKTSVCWEVSSRAAGSLAPLKELLLLPVTEFRGSQPAVMADLTRKIHRQLSDANAARRITIDWTPIPYLDQALERGRIRRIPAVLWIDPRTMRQSGPATNGLVDLEAFFIDGNKQEVIRKIRVRVESNPTRPKEWVQPAGTVWSILDAIRVTDKLGPGRTVGAVVLAGLGGHEEPPIAGRPLELLTELAVQRIIATLKQPAERQLPSQIREDQELVFRFGGIDVTNPGTPLPDAEQQHRSAVEKAIGGARDLSSE